MPTPLFPLPSDLSSSAAEAKKLFDAQKYEEAAAFCRQELGKLDKQIPSKQTKPPRDAEPGSAVYLYYALTVLAVDALAALEEWKTAKEVLGKYRVHFPRDPWGFTAGAEVTRRDPAVKDPAAVQRAVELLEGEARRLESMG